jgi:hypothetical protein
MLFISIGLFLLYILCIKAKIDYDYPKYYNTKYVVIRVGIYKQIKGINIPKTYVVIQDLKDSSLKTSINSLNFPSFIDNKYKVGDTLNFKFISKKRFGEN